MRSSDAPDAELRARIRTAEAYPFARPDGSYLFDGGTIRPIQRPDFARRVPVIACGANATAERLALKFAGRAARIPVTRARLTGFAVVYAAHFSSYGAIPATLHPEPAAETELFVTWLSASELERMHETEGVGRRYDYAELDGLSLDVEGAGRIDTAGAYLARNGAIAVAGGPVRIAALRARGSALPAWDQTEMLRHVHAQLAPELAYEAFMAELLEKAVQRERQSRRLEAVVAGTLHRAGERLAQASTAGSWSWPRSAHSG